MIAERTKTCRKCGDEKPVSDFYANKQSPDGIGYWCKSCHIAATKRSQANRSQALPIVDVALHARTLEEVAEVMGLTRSAAAQIEARALRKVRLEIARQMREGDETWALIGADFGFKVVDVGVVG